MMSTLVAALPLSSKRKIRIAIVSSPLAPYRIPLFNHLNALPNIELTVLLTQTRERSQQQQPETTDWEFAYQVFRSRGAVITTARSDRAGIYLSPSLLPHLARASYDVVIGLGWTMPNTFVAWLHRKLQGKPMILWDESIPHTPPRLKRILMPLLKRYIGSFDGYLVGSSWSQEYFVSMGAPRARVFLFPQVTDNDFFARGAAAQRAQREELKRALGIHTRQVLLFVGQFTVRKGIRPLLDAFECVAAENPAVGLVLVGQGPLEAEMRARQNRSAFGDRILIHGFAPQNILPKFYSIADLFVLPSLYDTFGVVIDEAMASGLPIVTTTQVGAVADLVREGVNGRVVAPGDAAALAQALAQLLNDDALLQAMSAQSSQRIATWNVDLAADGLMRCLVRCLAPPAAR